MNKEFLKSLGGSLLLFFVFTIVLKKAKPYLPPVIAHLV